MASVKNSMAHIREKIQNPRIIAKIEKEKEVRSWSKRELQRARDLLVTLLFHFMHCVCVCGEKRKERKEREEREMCG